MLGSKRERREKEGSPCDPKLKSNHHTNKQQKQQRDTNGNILEQSIDISTRKYPTKELFIHTKIKTCRMERRDGNGEGGEMLQQLPQLQLKVNDIAKESILIF